MPIERSIITGDIADEQIFNVDNVLDTGPDNLGVTLL